MLAAGKVNSSGWLRYGGFVRHKYHAYDPGKMLLTHYLMRRDLLAAGGLMSQTEVLARCHRQTEVLA